MGYLALDLSKRSTGFACLPDGGEKPIVGVWKLGSEYTSRGQTYGKLHAEMNALWRLTRFERIYYEEPLTHVTVQGNTNIETLKVLGGLAEHVQSFAYAIGARVEGINISSWRKDFIGSQKRGTKRQTLKALTLERCRQLGFTPRGDDEADAIGILDYSIGLNGQTPPWRRDEVLRPMLTGAA